MGIIAAFVPVFVLGDGDRSVDGWGAGIGIGAVAAAIFIGVRGLALPRLEILPAEGVLRTRRRTVPFHAIADVEMPGQSQSGVWANFRGDDDALLARMSIARSLFAEPTASQWAALQHTVHAAAVARGVPLAQRRAASGGSWTVGDAIAVLDAQEAWVRAGHRSHAKGAPARSLEGARIQIQPGPTHASGFPPR